MDQRGARLWDLQGSSDVPAKLTNRPAATAHRLNQDEQGAEPLDTRSAGDDALDESEALERYRRFFQSHDLSGSPIPEGGGAVNDESGSTVRTGSTARERSPYPAHMWARRFR